MGETRKQVNGEESVVHRKMGREERSLGGASTIVRYKSIRTDNRNYLRVCTVHRGGILVRPVGHLSDPRRCVASISGLEASKVLSSDFILRCIYEAYYETYLFATDLHI